jgi:hypothetical protein
MILLRNHVEHVKQMLIAQYITEINPREKQQQLVSNISQSKATETPGWPLSNRWQQLHPIHRPIPLK